MTGGSQPTWMILHNPSARRGRQVADQVRALLKRTPPPEPVRCEFVALSELARVEALRPERVIVVGGDGTITQAAEWLLRQGHSCPLAAVPGGTGNNLAAGLGLPKEVETALALARGGRETRSVDAISYGPEPRLFLQSGAFGFAADVAGRYDRLRKRRLFRCAARPLGANVYLLLAWLGLRDLSVRTAAGAALEVSVRLPEETFVERVAGVFLGNEKSLGGDFFPCPHAVVDDGLLDLCLVRALPDVSYREVFSEVRRGEHLSRDALVVYRQTPGPVTLQFSEPVAFLADGDLWTSAAEFTFELLPRRFAFVAS